jgi:hypothetical protein
MGFIRVLITDALTTPPFLKAASLVDTILEVKPHLDWLWHVWSILG